MRSFGKITSESVLKPVWLSLVNWSVSRMIICFVICYRRKNSTHLVWLLISCPPNSCTNEKETINLHERTTNTSEKQLIRLKLFLEKRLIDKMIGNTIWTTWIKGLLLVCQFKVTNYWYVIQISNVLDVMYRGLFYLRNEK